MPFSQTVMIWSTTHQYNYFTQPLKSGRNSLTSIVRPRFWFGEHSRNNGNNNCFIGCHKSALRRLISVTQSRCRNVYKKGLLFQETKCLTSDTLPGAVIDVLQGRGKFAKGNKLAPKRETSGLGDLLHFISNNAYYKQLLWASYVSLSYHHLTRGDWDRTIQVLLCVLSVQQYVLLLVYCKSPIYEKCETQSAMVLHCHQDVIIIPKMPPSGLRLTLVYPNPYFKQPHS